MKHYACAVLVENNRILLGPRAPRRAYSNRRDVIGAVRALPGLALAEYSGVIRNLAAAMGDGACP